MNLRDFLVQFALGWVGVMEATGNNDGLDVQMFQQAVDGLAQGEPWCFEKEVEILTTQGWVPFGALQDDTLVAQVDVDNLVSFVRPDAVVRKKYTGPGYHVKTRSMDFRVDAGHRFWGEFNNSASCRFASLAEVTHSLKIPATRSASGGSGLSPYEISLLAAFLAEGFVGATRQGKPRIRVQVSKARERRALEALNPTSSYTASRVYGATTKIPLTMYGFEVPEVFDELFEGYKLLKWSVLLSFNAAEAALFLEYYSKFDGNIPRYGSSSRRLFCSDPQQCSRLITIITQAGYIPSVTTQASGFPKGRKGFVITYALNKKTRVLSKRHITPIFMEEESLFCVSVPEGRILVRDKRGNPFVTGNCMCFAQFCIGQIEQQYGVAAQVVRSEHCLTVWDGSQHLVVNPPYPGCLVVWQKVGTTQGHVGIVTGVDLASGTFSTVEGNTSNGSGLNRDGDGVYEKVHGFVGSDPHFVLLGFLDPFLGVA